ncbi:MAG: PAS domain S-box protein [Methanomicrobium sp.]|nr:PAS domain S-box protein [Methanomicrobium sp.]
MEKIINAEELDEWTKKQLESPDIMWPMIYDAIADPVFILSNQGVILYCNRVSADFLGIPLEEIPGKHCYEMVHKTATFINGCPFVKSMSSKKRESYQLIIDEKWYMVTIDPLINDNNEVIGAIHFIKNINEIVSLNASRNNLAGIIENTTDAIGVYLSDGTITYWNHGSEILSGYSEKEMIGKNIKELIPEEILPHFFDVIEKVTSNIPVERFETIISNKNGEDKEVSMVVQPVYDSKKEISGFSFMAHDLSHERKAERELIYFITESALRIKRPVEILRNNLEEMKNLLASGNISENDVEKLLDVKISNANQILENLKELNAAIIESEKKIPEEYARFLKR